MEKLINRISATQIEAMMVVEVIEAEEYNHLHTHHVYMDKLENLHTINDVEDCALLINIDEDDFAEWASDNGFLEWEAVTSHTGEILCNSGITPYQEFIESNPFFLEENIKDYLIDKATQEK